MKTGEQRYDLSSLSAQYGVRPFNLEQEQRIATRLEPSSEEAWAKTFDYFFRYASPQRRLLTSLVIALLACLLAALLLFCL